MSGNSKEMDTEITGFPNTIILYVWGKLLVSTGNYSAPDDRNGQEESEI